MQRSKAGDFSPWRHKQVENDGQQDDKDQPLNPAHNVGQGNPGGNDDADQQREGCDIAPQVVDDKEHDDIGKGKNDLGPGVEPVNDGIGGIVLSDGDIFKHRFLSSLPARSPALRLRR